MEVTWKDIEFSTDNCVTICKKDGKTIFRILEGRDSYYADYENNLLFKSPRLKYCVAQSIAKERVGKHFLEESLNVAKEFFLENYKEQVFRMESELKRMSI